jgi:hypothetical protein
MHYHNFNDGQKVDCGLTKAIHDLHFSPIDAPTAGSSLLGGKLIKVGQRAVVRSAFI